MRGNNTLILNDATVMEALQEYFDKRMTPGVKVETIEKLAQAIPGTWSPTSGSPGFAVRVTEKKDELPRDPIQHKV